MRVAHQVAQPRLQVEGGKGGHLQSSGVRSRHAVRIHVGAPLLARRDPRHHLVGGYGVGLPYAQGDLRLGPVLSGHGRETQHTLSRTVPGADAKPRHLFVGTVEGDGPTCTSDHLEGTLDIEGDRRLPDPVLHGEERHRHGHLLTRTHHPRHGRQQRQRLPHEHLFRRGTVGALVSRHHHHAHLPDVLGKVHRVNAAHTPLQHERPDEPHHGREPAPVLFLDLHCVVPAQRQQPLQFGRVGARHLVEDVPRGDPERLLAVESPVQVGCLEAGQTQQPLVHDGQRIRHRPPRRLGDAHAHRCVGTPLVGNPDLGAQHGCRILDFERNHPVTGGSAGRCCAGSAAGSG